MNMFSRRDFLIVAASALGQLSICRAAHAEQALGCCIMPESDGDFEIAFGNQPEQGPDTDQLLATMSEGSGLGRDFERELGHVLSGLSRLFQVNPGFGFYDDTASMNAFAINRRKIAGTRGTVAFGRHLLSEEMDVDPYGISVAAISAHEFAHIYQYSSGFYDRIKSEQKPFCVELHADYLAGFFLRYFKDERPSTNLQKVGVAWEKMGSQDFTNPGSHGTRTQRLDSIQQGFADASDRITVDEAARLGFGYVKQYSAAG